MKSNMTINVEFLAGTELKRAVEEAKLKANLWEVAYICFDFNGTSFSIGAGADVLGVVEEWNNGAAPKYGICAS